MNSFKIHDLGVFRLPRPAGRLPFSSREECEELKKSENMMWGDANGAAEARNFVRNVSSDVPVTFYGYGSHVSGFSKNRPKMDHFLNK